MVAASGDQFQLAAGPGGVFGKGVYAITRGPGDNTGESPEEQTMSGSKARLQAIEAGKSFDPPAEIFPTTEAPGEIFGENVFTKAVMRQRLPKPVFKSVMATIEHSKPLDPTVADIVASAMKDWALEKGATHYAHVFQPLTNLTADPCGLEGFPNLVALVNGQDRSEVRIVASNWWRAGEVVAAGGAPVSEKKGMMEGWPGRFSEVTG